MVEEWRDIKGFEGLYQISNINEKRAIKKKWTFVPMSKEEYNALGV